MSSSVSAANWINVGSSGSWTDAAAWSTASVPGAGNNVLIGSNASAPTVPWTVTVQGAQAANNLTLIMGAQGTLSLGGALNVTGMASLGYGSLNGAVVDLGTGASFSAGAMVAVGSSFLVNGATITTGSYADLDKASATLENGGVWNANTFWVGQYFTTAVTVEAGSQLHAATQLNIGYDGSAKDPQAVGIGALTAAGGGEITAGALSLVDQSVLKIDSLSSVAIGGAGSVAGALVIGGGGSASLEWGQVQGNVVDDGAITAQINPTGSPIAVGTGPVITGALSGTGSVKVGGGYTMQVGTADGFAGNITIDPNAKMVVLTGAAPTGSISMSGGTLDLRGVAFTPGETVSYSGSDLSFGGQMLNVGAGLSPARFSVTSDGQGATPGTLIVETACYAAGTRIATERGEAPVETLRPGDRVRTAAGRIAPVRWIGRATHDVQAQPHLAPVRIAAGAFGPGLPRRDLLVSGDHAIAVGDVLVPARRLLNDCTIRQEPARGTVTYLHVELDRHDLLLAEGLAAESYLDTGNRGQLDGSGLRQVVGDAEAAALRAFAERGCAPLVLRGPEVDAARAALRARAEAAGWRLVTDPGLTVESDRRGIEVAGFGRDIMRIVLPPGGCELRLRSRSFVPAFLDPATPDGRRLGVALEVERDGARLEENAFTRGWYAADAGVQWRWTNGTAVLALSGRPHRSVLTVRVMAAGARYWSFDPVLARAA